MCTASQSIVDSALPLTGLLLNAFADSGSGAGDDGSAQYQAGLAGLDQAQATARLKAGQSLAEAAHSRELYQRQAAREAGRTRAGYGASGLGLDSGSILQLLADQSAEAQFRASGISGRAAGEVAAQRLNEEYAARKKALFHQQYERERKGGGKPTLLGAYNSLRAAASALELR